MDSSSDIMYGVVRTQHGSNAKHASKITTPV